MSFRARFIASVGSALAVRAAAALGLAALRRLRRSRSGDRCRAGHDHGARRRRTTTTTTTATTTTTVSLPGAGRPPVTIGDKNTTEQFVLGAALLPGAQGRGVHGLAQSEHRPDRGDPAGARQRPARDVPGVPRHVGHDRRRLHPDASRSLRDAYLAGQRYALKHGLELLNATPFSDTDAIAVTFDYAVENQRAVDPRPEQGAAADARRAAPVSAEPDRAAGARERLRRSFRPRSRRSSSASQYTALDQGTVQAADVNTTDAQLTQRQLPVAARPAAHVRLGQRRPGRRRSGARRRGPGVRGDDQPGQRAAHAVGDARAERAVDARRSGPRGRRDAVPAAARASCRSPRPRSRRRPRLRPTG